MKAIVVRNYRTQYPDPVTIAVGEVVVLGARDTEWPQFIWGTDRCGRSGWIPERVLGGDAGTVRCIEAYSARELDVDVGDDVRLLRETGGWWWCENARGAQGWVPATHLQIEDRTIEHESALRA